MASSPFFPHRTAARSGGNGRDLTFVFSLLSWWMMTRAGCHEVWCEGAGSMRRWPPHQVCKPLSPCFSFSSLLSVTYTLHIFFLFPQISNNRTTLAVVCVPLQPRLRRLTHSPNLVRINVHSGTQQLLLCCEPMKLQCLPRIGTLVWLIGFSSSSKHHEIWFMYVKAHA